MCVCVRRVTAVAAAVALVSLRYTNRLCVCVCVCVFASSRELGRKTILKLQFTLLNFSTILEGVGVAGVAAGSKATLCRIYILLKTRRDAKVPLRSACSYNDDD